MIEHLRDFILGNSELFGIEDTKQLPFLLESRNNPTFFFFESGTELPKLLVKLARSHKDSISLQREFDILKKLHSLTRAPIKNTIPLPLAFERVGGHWILCESFLLGRAIQPRKLAALRIDTFASAHATAVYDWVACFQEQTTVREEGFHGINIEGTFIEPVRRMLAASSMKTDVLAALQHRSGALLGKALPVVLIHGDLHPSNILLLGNKISGVVDWASSSPEGLPFHDWFQFLFEYGFELVKHRDGRNLIDQRLESIRVMFCDDNSTSRAAAFWTGKLLLKYGVDPATSSLWLLKFLSEVYLPKGNAQLVQAASVALMKPGPFSLTD